MAKRGRCRGPPASMHVDASGEGGVCADPSRVLEYACWFHGSRKKNFGRTCEYIYVNIAKKKLGSANAGFVIGASTFRKKNLAFCG